MSSALMAAGRQFGACSGARSPVSSRGFACRSGEFRAVRAHPRSKRSHTAQSFAGQTDLRGMAVSAMTWLDPHFPRAGRERPCHERRSWTRREAEKSGYWPEGRYSFLEGEGGAKLLGNAVPDPVTVPPLDGFDGQAMKQNREMQVVASRQSGLAREAQSVSRPDRLPL